MDLSPIDWTKTTTYLSANSYISNNSNYAKSFVCTQFKCQIVLFDSYTSGATTPCQSGPGSDGNEELLCISQSPSITGASSSDCFVSYLGYSFGESYSSAEML